MLQPTAHAALRTFAACAVLFVGAACREARVTGTPEVTFHTSESDADYAAADVEHLDAGGLAALAKRPATTDEWQQIFVVHAGDTAGLPMMGVYTVSGTTLRFKPRFPALGGTTYIARYDAAAFNRLTGLNTPAGGARATWSLDAVSGPSTTVVENVFPSTDSVPMNLLRMYIQFSAPMTVGDSAEHRITLFDDRGRAVEAAFLVAAGGQELWDGEHTRMTLFFDPGRIKRNLRPHEALGLPLQDGRSYRLVIDSAWRDAQGRTLARGFEKRFRVGAVDRGLPRTSTWKVSAPAANTHDTLRIVLPEPLDRALLMRMLVVKRANGALVPGRVTVLERETVWIFAPSSAWQRGDHYIEVDTELEDLAGNNLKHLFDVMPSDSASQGVSGARTRVAFVVR